MTMASTDMAFEAAGGLRRKRLTAIGVLVAILAYLTYIFFAFEVGKVFSGIDPDDARILVSDSYSYKTHVTQDNRNGEVEIAIEGERKGRYDEGASPDWVSLGDVVEVELEDGAFAVLEQGRAFLSLPDYGDITVEVDGRRISADFPEGSLAEMLAIEEAWEEEINAAANAIILAEDGVADAVSEMGRLNALERADDLGVVLPVRPDTLPPEWISLASNKVTVTAEEGRFSVTASKSEVFRYFGGWELFFFTLDSPYHGMPFGEVMGRMFSGEGAAIWEDFWENEMWRHGEVAWAIGETILMAFLGTFGAAIIALPLAFIAAKNFTPLGPVRFIARRFFDFVRGVDGLIWTIILSRAFGPGPMTGALAILITDTGSFGKMFSEALENVDGKQIEGVASTGAKPLQRYRFGVIPQITPVFLSQILYYLESNTRSATIIGAITGGGIGLLLTQAIITQKDWEEVTYYIVLIVLMVMLMDWFSGWLRRRLISGDT